MYHSASDQRPRESDPIACISLVGVGVTLMNAIKGLTIIVIYANGNVKYTVDMLN